MIRNIALKSVQTSENKKQLVKSIGQCQLEGLKTSSSEYMTRFQSSAKGKWVTQAQTTFENTSNQLANM